MVEQRGANAVVMVDATKATDKETLFLCYIGTTTTLVLGALRRFL